MLLFSNLTPSKVHEMTGHVDASNILQTIIMIQKVIMIMWDIDIILSKQKKGNMDKDISLDQNPFQLRRSFSFTRNSWQFWSSPQHPKHPQTILNATHLILCLPFAALTCTCVRVVIFSLLYSHIQHMHTHLTFLKIVTTSTKYKSLK